MIGTNLNLSLPTLGDTYSSAISKIATALSQIQTSIADKATPAGLNINTAFDMGGNAITNLTSVQLASGNTPNVAGSIFYYNGEFYAIDTTGTIQLTSNGQLNAASIGGIGGDYGGVNPAKVTYDNASGQYRFTRSPGVWADIVCKDLVLEGTSATVTMGVDSGLSVSRILNFKSLPASGVGLIVYNAATSTIEDIASTSPTTISVTCPITTTQPVQASKVKTTANMTYVCPGTGALELGATTSFQHTRREWGYDIGGTNAVAYPIMLPVGAVISAMKVFISKGSNNTITLTAQMRKFNSATGALTNVGGGVTTSSNAPGITTMSDATSTGTISANEQWFVEVSASGLSGGTDSFRHIEVTYTLPNGAS